MRTTINLPDELLARAKKEALHSGTTLTDLIADALRETLSRRAKKEKQSVFEVYTFGSGGLQPGVDLDDTSALLDLMDGLDDPARR